MNEMRAHAFWAPDEIALVRRKWNQDGASAGEIARQVGRSRNAVCGLINRRPGEFEARSTAAARLRKATAPKVARPCATKAARSEGPMGWRRDEVDAAREMWADRVIIKDMAAKLGKNHDVVNRFINENRDLFPNRNKPRKPGAVMAERPLRPLPVRVAKPDPEPVEGGVPLMEPAPNGCHYIVSGDRGGALFCGAAVVGVSSWCACHHARVFQATAA